MIMTRDISLHYHHQDVCKIAMGFSIDLGLSEDVIRVIKQAALSHDLGKLMIPDDILLKSKRLTESEYEIIKKHPMLGANLYKDSIKQETYLPSLHYQKVFDAILHHHEWHDGTGYPHGLKGNNISLEAKIVSIADAYSAMTTDRPYGKALRHSDALAEIERYSGKQFDPEICSEFLSCRWLVWECKCSFKKISNCSVKDCCKPSGNDIEEKLKIIKGECIK